MNRNLLFKYGCLGVGVLYVLLAGSILVRGVESSMRQFAVPDPVLTSPHYDDAMIWVYVHMAVLGTVIGVVGWFAESPRLKQAFCLMLICAHAIYLYLDLRTSDTAFGNGLYQGPASAIPAMIGFAVLIVFIGLWLTTLRPTADS